MADIREYAEMSKFRLSEDESVWIENMVKCLEYSFSKLENVETGEIDPLISVLSLQNVLRKDTASKMLSGEELLSNAPEQYDGYFQVPRTLE